MPAVEIVMAVPESGDSSPRSSLADRLRERARRKEQAAFLTMVFSLLLGFAALGVGILYEESLPRWLWMTFVIIGFVGVGVSRWLRHKNDEDEEAERYRLRLDAARRKAGK